MISTMKNAVDMAVDDLYLATSYVLEHAEHWQIDPRRIIISGSSAGAITVLQAENGLCNSPAGSGRAPRRIPLCGRDRLRRSHILYRRQTALGQGTRTDHVFSTATPTATYHIKKASLMGIGYYGPQIITRQLDKLGSPYYFYSAQCVDHSLAVTPLEDKLDLILQFIRDYIDQGRRLRIRTDDVEKIDCKGCKTRFSIRDYLDQLRAAAISIPPDGMRLPVSRRTVKPRRYTGYPPDNNNGRGSVFFVRR